MIFAAPWVLLALLGLPVLWWLLRATPPAPREQRFPAIRLLSGLQTREESPARTPWWLLLLRLSAAALVIAAVAGPVLRAGRIGFAAPGAVLLVLDDGFASGPDWAARLEAAQSVLDRAERQGRKVALLGTADDMDGARPRASPAMPASELRPLLAASRVKPWPTDREAAARGFAGLAAGPVMYLSDGLAGSADAVFSAALAAHGPVTVLLGEVPARVLQARPAPDRLVARLLQTPFGTARQESVLAETGDGRVLARTAISIPAGAVSGQAEMQLPAELRNQLTALVLAASPGAGSVALLDEGSRRRPVGLLGATAGAETPLLGEFFYVDRALAPTAELRRGDLASLLGQRLSMLVVAGRALTGADGDRVAKWVEGGGLLVRFAGPDLAGAAEDRLLPVPLLTGDRQLGGAMSWNRPAHLAGFPQASPFAGLAVPAEVTVSRQILADPTAVQTAQTWARLTDGTPLVTASRRGAGEIVLFHVTANADWSDLPLSGLFVEMLQRLVARSAGVGIGDDAGLLVPSQALDGQGVLAAPPASARAASAAALASLAISPAHPPGFYGPEAGRRALNLGRDGLVLKPIAMPAGATVLSLRQIARERPVGPWLVALALLLLCADLILGLRLRGLLGPALAAWLLMALWPGSAWAQDSPALSTHLAYVITGDAEVDETSKLGLGTLSDYVNARTAAVLAEPNAVTPGQDDLSFYPLLYWPITDGVALPARAIAALNDYTRHGGIIVIDLRGGSAAAAGSGAGFSPGGNAALRRMTAGLDIPALAPLTTAHVLARAFYLLGEFPGRYAGDTVWVQQDQDRANDSVSPVVIGANDWAAAWAADEDGKPLHAVIPGGQRQRTLAFRFGVNLVMYALTGNYKGDQVHVPAILERLGQ